MLKMWRPDFFAIAFEKLFEIDLKFFLDSIFIFRFVSLSPDFEITSPLFVDAYQYHGYILNSHLTDTPVTSVFQPWTHLHYKDDI